MLQEGKITADEADRLLNALAQSSNKSKPRPAPVRDRRQLRVRVTDLDSGRATVNVNIPMGLVNMGIKLGARFIPSDADLGMDMDELMEAIESGESGKIVDVENLDDGERVEVWIE
jgi:hypothetical protein